MSVYDGDQISPQDAYEHFTNPPPGLGQKAVGVLAVAVAECESLNLIVNPDPLAGFPQHAVIDFNEISGSRVRRTARQLNKSANERGWQYRPSA